jgi:hypothetical protein
VIGASSSIRARCARPFDFVVTHERRSSASDRRPRSSEPPVACSWRGFRAMVNGSDQGRRAFVTIHSESLPSGPGGRSSAPVYLDVDALERCGLQVVQPFACRDDGPPNGGCLPARERETVVVVARRDLLDDREFLPCPGGTGETQSTYRRDWAERVPNCHVAAFCEKEG